MNLKIKKEEHERLNQFRMAKYVFGSRLFGTENENSDTDYLCVYGFEGVFGIEEEKFSEYPNIHSFQYDDKENNTQYIWMTLKQFVQGKNSGDGTIITDVVLFSENNGLTDKEKLDECRTYKIIKGYCGVAKRDIKLHPKSENKRFHAMRSIYIANCLMSNVVPSIEQIQYLKKNIAYFNIEDIVLAITDARIRASKMLDDGELTHYNLPKTEDTLLDKFLGMNNIGEFKYN